MSIRRTSIDRLNEARKSARPTIGKGKPLNSQGDDGDLTFRRTSDGLKLYIKAAGKWNGVKVGESFDDLEKSLNNLQKIVSTIKKFRLPNTYSVTGDFTLDASGDIILKVGDDMIFQITEAGVDGNTVDVDNACIGFTQIEATAGASVVIGGGGNDTDIDFRHSNKYYLEPAALSITNMNLIFPSVSGNFLLNTRSSGGWSVTNWKAYESDESAATTAGVMWPGGTAPTYTNSGYDVFSFYWDATTQRCFGVGNAGFTTP
tara:strand:+ start:626 stop:1405 length:780 start_codon:yes stop_codon:yes gene_type:complete